MIPQKIVMSAQAGIHALLSAMKLDFRSPIAVEDKLHGNDVK